MKKIFTTIVTFFILTIIPHAVLAQNDSVSESLPDQYFIDLPEDLPQNTVNIRPYCDGPFNKCGFAQVEILKEGLKWGELILPAIYESAFEFSEGLAAVRIKGRWGFINMKGDIIIDPQFELVASFNHDLAEVLIDGKVGVINRQGDLVIKPQFARAIPFSKDVVFAQPGDWQFIHSPGYGKLENIKESGLSFWSGLYGLYSIESGWITKPEWKFDIFDSTGKISLIWAKHKDSDSLYGLMRPDGSWQLKPQYDRVSFLKSNELTEVNLDEELKPGQTKRQRLYGTVNSEGKIIEPLGPWKLNCRDKGFDFTGTKDLETDKEGFLDTAGNLLGKRWFDSIGCGKNGIAAVMIDRVWQGMDQQGNIVAHPRDNEVFKECPSSGLKLVYISRNYQFVDSSGQPTVPYLLDSISTWNFDCDKIISVSYNGKWGYVNREGHLLFDPPEFDNTSSFSDGYAAVQKNKKWGIINEQGKFTVQPLYDDLRYLGDGIFKASLAHKDLWINNEGTKQTKPKPKEIDRSPYLTCPGNVKIIANNTQGDLWGMADENNKVIIKPLYRAIHCFKNGITWVPNDDKRQWCPLDSDGVIQDYPKCMTSRYPSIQTDTEPEEFTDDPYENSVLWSRAHLEFGAGLREKPPHPRKVGHHASYSIK